MQNSLQILAASHPLLKSQFVNAEQCFKEYLQMAIYSDLDAFESVIPSRDLKDQTNTPIILYLDNPLPQTQMFQKLYFSLIRKLNELKENQKYKIVVVDRKGNHQSFYSLVNILRMVPIRYIETLNIYVLSERLLNREQLKQNPFQNYISNITVIVSSIQKLKQMNMKNIITALKEEDIQNLNYKSLQKTMGTFRNNFVNRNLKQPINIDQILQTKRHPTISSYELHDGVPKVLIQLLETLKSKLDTPGIFRISPSIDQQKIYLPYLDQQNIEKLKQIENPHTLTSLIKKIFGRLEPPIFSYELYEFITMEEFNGESGLYLIISILKKLPVQNYESLKYLSRYINKNVLIHSESNKMKSGTLAVILAPVLLRSYNPSHDDLKFMNKMILVVKSLIQSYEFVFQQPSKPLEIQQKQQVKSIKQQKIKQQVIDKTPPKNQIQKKNIDKSESQMSFTSEMSKQSNQIIFDKTITMSMSEYDCIQSSPNKSIISQPFQSTEEQSTSIPMHSLIKKRSAIQQNRQSKLSTEESSNKIMIGSCQIIQDREQPQKIAKSDSMSDFQKLEPDDI